MLADSPDVLLQLVAHSRRRRILQQLRHDPAGETAVDELLDRLQTGGSGAETGRITDREQLAVQLYHIHLPKLADHGVVEHDRRRGTVRYRANEQVEAVLDSFQIAESLASP